MPRHVAVDLGASGGRVAVGTVENGRMEVEVLHRFDNPAIQLPSGLYWDCLGLWREIGIGLRGAASRGDVASVGVNSWGVDYALLDEDDLLIDGIHHYRDPRTDDSMGEVFTRVPAEAVYEATGIQFMPLNTIFQLSAHRREAPHVLERTKTLLMVPDLFHYWLSGAKVTEATIASTTQLFAPTHRTWSSTLIDRCGYPKGMFRPIVEPGTIIGEALPAVGLGRAKVVAPAAHDTASAVAAVPAAGDDWAYISCGTWALVGVEIPKPAIDDTTRRLNFTNEAGIRGTTRLLKNVVGLWILQECRRAWGDPEYPTLYEEAGADRGTALIDPDDPRFAAPCDRMPERVREFCAESGQEPPEGRGAITSCILRSLAAKCVQVVGEIEQILGRRIGTIHVVGGGSRIELLNRLIANSSGRPVLAGPVEATLMGNLLVQAEALGSIPRGSIRETIRQSQSPVRYDPRP